MKIIEGTNVSKKFGALAALKDVNFSICSDQILGLIGPNGAGKTTLFNVITGVYKPEVGRIFLKGIDITGFPPYKICRLGAARTFQTPRVFTNLSIKQNVKLAERFGKRHESRNSKAKSLLEFVNLAHKADKMAQDTSLFERRLLEIAMALATSPDVVLLDEPLSGLSPEELKSGMELITRIRSDLGISVFWIEHVMEAIMKVADKIIVLNAGEKIAEGTPMEIAHDKNVIEAYLGETG
ncbi:MAG: ABC transporter ATP-binding protein [Candidatus Bathyarchaeia archaeon]